MNNSILRTLLLSFLGLGIMVALIFPFYANFFVDWKPGMLPWFVIGCLIAELGGRELAQCDFAQTTA